MKKLLILTCALIFSVILCSASVFASDGGNEARVGGTEYATLQEAIDAAESGDTVTLLKDLTLESTLADAGKGIFNISKDDKITIDLNGKAINVTDNSSGNLIVFYNYGDLTIKNGSVSLTSTVDRGWNAESAIILSRGGHLTIESGSLVHNGGTSMAFAIDISGNSFGDAYATINGGEITSSYRAVRMRMENVDIGGCGAVYMSITGGTISGGNAGVWGQNASSYSGGEKIGNLEVTGGTVSGVINAINMAATVNNNLDVAISGDALIDGNLKGTASDFKISGGTFTKEISSDFFAQGFEPALNDDGTYGAKPASITLGFTFLGYSINAQGSSITAGYIVDFDIVDAYCKYNGVTLNDFGVAFGIGAIIESTATSFAKYNKYNNYDAMIVGFDPDNTAHTSARLAMAFYIDLGLGKQYVIENAQGEIELVAYNQAPTTSFAEQIASNN